MAALLFSSSVACLSCRRHHVFSLRPTKRAVSFLSSSSSAAATVAFVFLCKGGNHSRFPEEKGENPETQPEPPSPPESPKQESAAAGFARAISDEWGKKNVTERKLPSLPDLIKNDGESGIEAGASAAAAIIDELGKKSAPESEHPSQPGTPKDNDERSAGSDAISPKSIIAELGNKAIPEIEALSRVGSRKVEVELGREGFLSGIGTPALLDDKLGALKRRLVDSLNGTELGLRTSVEGRAEILELVSQLEAENPTPIPAESPKLDGNWILM